jgi:hypothetical protein
VPSRLRQNYQAAFLHHSTCCPRHKHYSSAGTTPPAGSVMDALVSRPSDQVVDFRLSPYYSKTDFDLDPPPSSAVVRRGPVADLRDLALCRQDSCPRDCSVRLLRRPLVLASPLRLPHRPVPIHRTYCPPGSGSAQRQAAGAVVPLGLEAAMGGIVGLSQCSMRAERGRRAYRLRCRRLRRLRGACCAEWRCARLWWLGVGSTTTSWRSKDRGAAALRWLKSGLRRQLCRLAWELELYQVTSCLHRGQMIRESQSGFICGSLQLVGLSSGYMR